MAYGLLQICLLLSKQVKGNRAWVAPILLSPSCPFASLKKKTWPMGAPVPCQSFSSAWKAPCLPPTVFLDDLHTRLPSPHPSILHKEQKSQGAKAPDRRFDFSRRETEIREEWERGGSRVYWLGRWLMVSREASFGRLGERNKLQVF